MWTWIAHPVIDVYTITKDDIERVATFADLNDALKLLQRNIGQKDGGIAAQVFSSHKHLPDGNTEEWFNASYDERIVMLLDYLRYEKESAQRNDEEPKFKLDWKD